jgi:hypothetical protein
MNVGVLEQSRARKVRYVHLGANHTRRNLLHGTRQHSLLPPLAADGALGLQREAERSAGWESHDASSNHHNRELSLAVCVSRWVVIDSGPLSWGPWCGSRRRTGDSGDSVCLRGVLSRLMRPWVVVTFAHAHNVRETVAGGGQEVAPADR